MTDAIAPSLARSLEALTERVATLEQVATGLIERAVAAELANQAARDALALAMERLGTAMAGVVAAMAERGDAALN